MKFKSFEQFVTEMDRAEEIEKDIKDTGAPEPMDVEDTEAEADEVQTNEAEESHEEGETPEEEAKEEEAKKVVSEILESCYQEVVKEAMAWENDAHDDHTAESYMAENAALVAGLAGKALKECKEAYGIEAYEAALNTIKEAFSNKIDSIKLQESGQDAEDGEGEPEAE